MVAMVPLGDVALIANPAARSGAGARAAERAASLLEHTAGARSVELLLTEHSGHATELAQQSAGYDTLVALGGDGTVNEVMNGLMRLERDQRPAFALIPYGSGNDYARTLGMPVGVERAVRALGRARKVDAELGCCNGRYFAETLSFGLDAGIALDTVRRRARTGSAGLRLYAESSADQLLHNKKEYAFQMTLEDGTFKTGRMLILAVQVGRTYGSGFMICPNARIDDGLLDICIGHAPIHTLSAALLFLKAKRGKHTSNKQIESFQTRGLKLRFDGKPPVQIDGEELRADAFSIHVVPNAVTVLAV